MLQNSYSLLESSSYLTGLAEQFKRPNLSLRLSRGSIFCFVLNIRCLPSEVSIASPHFICLPSKKFSPPIHVLFLPFKKNLLCLEFLSLKCVPDRLCLKNSLLRPSFLCCFLILIHLLSSCLLVCFCFNPGVKTSFSALSLFFPSPFHGFFFFFFLKIISFWAEISLIFKCCTHNALF